ncbi:MAG: tRNA glutamyl-Q(34) synthetase GluQRS [Burkholderiales bacterium]|nr:tRNA glutamyl-Q(34) synthetase GluQRS [Burkholderiales bacterium]MDE2394602.1 tRNA glutamyl-Q(34) synthetase GluQRS [Burkholderiales bacterium]MDE2454516.1 tRNA glutamyl-Q(34) synthetase GluQRS [Burkholderiales bacterium]
MGYRGRFAPSPTGALHAGSLVAALASWLDARAAGGAWLVRIEDVDRPRCIEGMDRVILAQLAACAMHSDEPVRYQSARDPIYERALQRLVEGGRAYPCGCTRKQIDEAWAARGFAHRRGEERVYPGTCRDGLHGRPARAWRFRVEPGRVDWRDRRLGPQFQDVEREVGDFVLKRADGLWAYQLAVVVDDAEQGITDIVRGADLADNTPRQIQLQRALGLAQPHWLHAPLVLGADGHKLSKQNGAQAFDAGDALGALQAAAAVLGLPPLSAATPAEWLAAAVPAWAGMMRTLRERISP